MVRCHSPIGKMAEICRCRLYPEGTADRRRSLIRVLRRPSIALTLDAKNLCLSKREGTVDIHPRVDEIIENQVLRASLSPLHVLRTPFSHGSRPSATQPSNSSLQRYPSTQQPLTTPYIYSSTDHLKKVCCTPAEHARFHHPNFGAPVKRLPN